MSVIAKRARKIFKEILLDYQLYLFLLPTIIWYILFRYLPIYGLKIAFLDYNPALGIASSKWVGLKHFNRFVNSYFFKTLIRNTLTLSLYSLVVSTPIPIILSLMLNELRSDKYKRFIQTIAYAPHFISTVVIVGMLNLFFSQSFGIINFARVALGMDARTFLTEASSFRSLYVWSGIWQNAGWSCIIYLSALSAVDPQLHEAATIDGATRLQRIWHINIPEILPTFTILLIISAGSIMNVGFEKTYLMQNELNSETSEVISTYVYKRGLIDMDFSFSSAVGLFNNAINFLMVILVNRVARKVSETSLF